MGFYESFEAAAFGFERYPSLIVNRLPPTYAGVVM